MAKPYQITVTADAISGLQEKLTLTALPNELSDATWTTGSPLPDIQRLVSRWQHEYDWRSAEADLNRQLPQYITSLDIHGFGNISVHFVHQKRSQSGSVPLLFVHGWPGSFMEVKKLLPLLKDSAVAFDVVAPSLPNFGFSDGIRKTGFALKQYAETCHKLMQSLGYNEYVTQGGDWGFYITRCIGRIYPESCLASHVNMIRVSPFSFTSAPFVTIRHWLRPSSDFENIGNKRSKWFENEGSAYRALQATKPETLGFALTDSPAALLAWIYEKLHDWTDDYPWTDDEVLTWVSIYWFSVAGPAAASRIYFESTHTLEEKTSRDAMTRYIPGPKLGVAFFPKELSVVPRTLARALGNVVYESTHDKGGHFAAWEKPHVVVNDLVAMFGPGGPCEGIIAKAT